MRTRLLILAVLASLVSSSALAASYDTGGGLVGLIDPIQCWSGCVGDHPYAGPNLAPGVIAPGADLAGARLGGARLNGADLTGANFSGANLDLAYLAEADLSFADLSNADLGGVIFVDANLTGADLTGASLFNAEWLGRTSGSPFYDINTDFTDAWATHFWGSEPFDPVAAGWTLVPEPSTALLMGLGLAGLASRWRR